MSTHAIPQNMNWFQPVFLIWIKQPRWNKTREKQPMWQHPGFSFLSTESIIHLSNLIWLTQVDQRSFGKGKVTDRKSEKCVWFISFNVESVEVPISQRLLMTWRCVLTLTQGNLGKFKVNFFFLKYLIPAYVLFWNNGTD